MKQLVHKMKQIIEQAFFQQFQNQPDIILSCGGRFEVLGNHTDHNHGLCIAATCSLSIYGAFKKRCDSLINLHSEGYQDITLDLKSLNIIEEEKGSTASLIRGINAYLSNDYQIGGFDAYIKSEIPNGAGVSSSAAFELLIAQAVNYLFNKKQIPLMTLCKAGQYAERTYYGKMCGLLDQIGVAYGGLVYMDFKHIDNPYVEPLLLDLKDYQFLIVNTGGSHAALSHLYTAIPDDMKKVAHFFNKEYLREIDLNDLQNNKEQIETQYNKDIYLRALHFFNENQRVESAYNAIKNKDIDSLINLMNESRVSSTNYLKNMFVESEKDSPLEACNLILKSSNNKAGVKINGGGFAGSVIALLPRDEINSVVKACTEKYGKENVHLVAIRNDVPCLLK